MLLHFLIILEIVQTTLVVASNSWQIQANFYLPIRFLLRQWHTASVETKGKPCLLSLIFLFMYLLPWKCSRYQTAHCYSSMQHMNNAASFHLFNRKK